MKTKKNKKQTDLQTEMENPYGKTERERQKKTEKTVRSIYIGQKKEELYGKTLEPLLIV